MDHEIKNRLNNIFNDFDNIQKSIVVNKKKNNKKNKKKKSIENLAIKNTETVIQNIESINLDYSKELHIFSKSSQIYLPIHPIPNKVLKIINLGDSLIKLISNENENIFHNFYSPKGSINIFITTNSSIEIFFIEKETGEKIWIAK